MPSLAIQFVPSVSSTSRLVLRGGGGAPAGECAAGVCPAARIGATWCGADVCAETTAAGGGAGIGLRRSGAGNAGAVCGADGGRATGALGTVVAGAGRSEEH